MKVRATVQFEGEFNIDDELITEGWKGIDVLRAIGLEALFQTVAEATEEGDVLITILDENGEEE